MPLPYLSEGFEGLQESTIMDHLEECRSQHESGGQSARTLKRRRSKAGDEGGPEASKGEGGLPQSISAGLARKVEFSAWVWARRVR